MSKKKNQKHHPLSILIVAVLAVVAYFFFPQEADPQNHSKPETESSAPAPGVGDVRHSLCTSLSSQAQAYYTGEYSFDTLSGLKGSKDAPMDSPLFDALHNLMTDTMTDSVTYRSLTKYFPETDCTNGSENASLIYSDSVSSDSYSREHVWPKSKASFHIKDGGCDIHHLRPENTAVNSTRRNYIFGNVRGVLKDYKTDQYEGRDVLYYSSTENRVELNDNVKGDVARILLYVYVRWEEPNLYMDVENPVTGPEEEDINTGERVIESLDTLLQWCQEDPVDQWEMVRNDKCQDIQGNRNVFIDYPELAWLLFGKEVPASMPTPTA